MDEEKLAEMVDITKKPPVHRTATASGSIQLKESTIEAIKSGQVKKGDVLTTARLAAILAVKDTPRLIPLCHPIPITALEVNFELEQERVKATVTVTSVGKTGVEMEALRESRRRCITYGIWSSTWRRTRRETSTDLMDESHFKSSINSSFDRFACCRIDNKTPMSAFSSLWRINGSFIRLIPRSRP